MKLTMTWNLVENSSMAFARMKHCIATHTTKWCCKTFKWTFLEKACYMLLNAGVLKEFHVETINFSLLTHE